MMLERRVKHWKPARKQAYFQPFCVAWDRYGAKALQMEVLMYQSLVDAIDALDRLEAQRMDLQHNFLLSLYDIAPELLAVLRQFDWNDAAIGDWLCHPNANLSGARPIELIATGEAAVIMAMAVRAWHGLGRDSDG